MTRFRPICSLLAGVMALGVTLAPAPAAAQRKSPLVGQPVVRHKMELRQKRLELVPMFETSVAADLTNTYSFGVKLEYHLSDMLSVGAMGFFGVNVNSGLANQIRDTLPDSETAGDPTPTKTQFDQHLNTSPFHGAVHATLTPWFGKMAVFGKAYINFDIYLQGGLGFAQTKNSWSGASGATLEQCPDFGDNPATEEIEDSFIIGYHDCYNDARNDDPANSGFMPGLMLGAGIHAFINRWIAVDLSVHDYMFSDNPSGLDYDGDRKVDGNDRRFLGHLYFGVGAALYFPPKAKISR